MKDQQKSTPASDGKQPLPLRLRPMQKKRWLEQSRLEGKRINDWVAERVEAHGFSIPEQTTMPKE